MKKLIPTRHIVNGHFFNSSIEAKKYIDENNWSFERVEKLKLKNGGIVYLYHIEPSIK